MGLHDRTTDGSLSYNVGTFLVRVSDTRLGRLVFSVALGAVAGIVQILIHNSLAAHSELADIAEMADAALVGLFVFLLTTVELGAVRERRMRVIDDVRTIGELNHHIRNALQAIQYAAYTSTDQSKLEVVNESVERVDRILKELFPVLDSPISKLRPPTRKEP